MSGGAFLFIHPLLYFFTGHLQFTMLLILLVHGARLLKLVNCAYTILGLKRSFYNLLPLESCLLCSLVCKFI
uniref:Uncharacterized protein n=1 Tax=Populus trichocarpa TaxID=3694 RepID=A9PGD3_POPTR|nr:unknown [Populus trichocarpa]